MKLRPRPSHQEPGRMPPVLSLICPQRSIPLLQHPKLAAGGMILPKCALRLHNTHHCALPMSRLRPKRGTLTIKETAGAFVHATHQSVVDGITAGRKTSSSTIDQGLLLLARRASRRAGLVSITVDKGRSIGLRWGEVVVCPLKCSLREELTWRCTCDSCIGRCPEAREEVT